MKKLFSILLVLLLSSAVNSQSLIQPTSLTTYPTDNFFSGTKGHCFDYSGLSGTPVDVASAATIVHSSPGTATNAAFTANGVMETSWEFFFSANDVKGIALWLPCAAYPHGDAPIKKISVFNGTTTDIFELGAPSDSVKFVNFSSTYVGATSIVIEVLETWYDLDLLSPDCGASGWGVHLISDSVNPQYNVTIGEVMFILDDNPVSEPCGVTIDIEHSIERCGLTLTPTISAVPAGYTVMSTTWTFGDGYSSNLLNTSHYYGDAGTYEVCLEVIIFNGEECCTVKRCFEIRIEEPCDADCSIEAEIVVGDIDGCERQFIGNILYTGTPITNWVWDFGDGGTGIGSNVTHTYLTPGTYIVTLTVFGSSHDNEECCFVTIRREISVDCIAESDFKTIKDGKTTSTKAINNVTLYPNPTNGVFNLRIENAENSVVEVVNGLGETILIQNINKSVTIIDLTNQPNGIYFVKVVSADFTVVERVIKS